MWSVAMLRRQWKFLMIPLSTVAIVFLIFYIQHKIEVNRQLDRQFIYKVEQFNKIANDPKRLGLEYQETLDYITKLIGKPDLLKDYYAVWTVNGRKGKPVSLCASKIKLKLEDGSTVSGTTVYIIDETKFKITDSSTEFSPPTR